MQWYYSDQGLRKGPVEESALEELVLSGVVNNQTLVWHEGMQNWQPHESVRGPRAAPAVPPPSLSDVKYCSGCGRPFPSSELVPIGLATVCAACKPTYLQQMREAGSAVLGQRHYGGFWMRFVARLLDGILLNIVFLAIRIPLGVPLFGPAAAPNPALAAAALASALLFGLLSIVITACYEIFMVAQRGATIGKMLVGLKVIRADGSSLSTGLSAGRYFSTWISTITLGIGYLMAGFDDEKRSLHDRICDTRVIYGK